MSNLYYNFIYMCCRGMSKYEIRDPTKIGGMKIREGSDNNKKGCLSTRAKFMLLGLFIITLVSVIVILSILLAYKEKVSFNFIVQSYPSFCMIE